MQTALRLLAPHLDRLSDGEPGLRSQWVTPTMELFRAHPAVEMIQDGDFTSYDDAPKYRLADGAVLEPDSILLHYATAFERSYPQFRVLRERHGRPDLPFQVGIPNPFDLTVFVFAERGFSDPALMAAFADATLREIRRIVATAGDDVVFQIETVVAVSVLSEAPDDGDAASRMAAPICELAAAAPAGTRFGLHLCVGDFQHKAYAHVQSVRPWVRLANEISARWPASARLDYVHAPLAVAEEPPPDDRAFYEPLADLTLRSGTRFVAGFIHEQRDTERLVELLELIEELYGDEVDVAAACGLARRPDPDQAWDAMRKASELIARARPHS